MHPRGRWVAALVIAALVAGGLLTVATTRPAAACSCLAWTDAEAVAAADVVFRGSVVEVTRVGPAEDGPESARVFRVAVAETYKGTTRPDQAVRTPVHSASCGVRVRTGESVLVFATRRTGELSTTSCSGTRVLDGPVPDDVVDATATPTVACASAIDAVGRLPSGYRSIAGVVALPTARPLEIDTTAPPPYSAKVGLAVRAGATATLSVTPRAGDTLAIGWGDVSSVAALRVSDCQAAGGETWVVFAGGFWVDRPRCVPLDVTGARTVRVRIGVGKACGSSR